VVLLIDNYDSFTYMLRDYVLQCGRDCRVIRNDEMSMAEVEALHPASVILSPGPKAPVDAGITLDVIHRFRHQLPILGICLGHQAIGQAYGAALVQAVRPMHGKVSTICHTGHPLFQGVPAETEVMRYHSLILDRLAGTSLQVIAETLSGEVMAIADTDRRVAGLQFHPESVLTSCGLQIIRNWFTWISA
jgi:anthranilate synthase/aminodeoxychorismate synthase-like glutamine amidotransferase